MQDMKGTLDELLDYVRGIWIKKRYIIVTSWLIIPLGLGFVAMMPDKYQSQSRIYVDTRSMLQPLLQGIAVNTDPEQELQMIVQTLLSRQNVEAIARGADLDITTRTNDEYVELIDKLATDIEVRRISRRDNLFTISYSHQSARTSQVVVQETLDLFVEGAIGESRADSDNASRFLDEQVSDYERRLSQSEQQLADFQRQYAYLLPVAGTFYENLQRVESELDEAELLKLEAEEQKESLLEQLRLRSNASASNEISSEDSPRISTVYDGRIQALEVRLDELRLRFTDVHPDVVETAKMLDGLKATRDREVQVYLSQQTSDEGAISNVTELNLDLHAEISRVEGVIASLSVRIIDYQAKINDLRSKIDLVPQVEAEQTALNRDYEILRQKYTELLSRRESAGLSQRADVSSDDLQFRIIEPPQLPLSPSGPNRLVFYTLVVILGFGSGAGLAFLISQFSPILFRASQLNKLTDYPVLGAVSHLNRAAIAKTAKIRITVFLFSSITLLSMYGVLMAAEIMQIDVISRVF